MSEDQQAGAMEEGIVPLNITHQYVKDLSFENPGAPALFLQPPDGAPDIAIEVNVTADQIGENFSKSICTWKRKPKRAKRCCLSPSSTMARLRKSVISRKNTNSRSF